MGDLKRIFIVDPNSYNNLQLYDEKLIENLEKITPHQIVLIGNKKYKDLGLIINKKLIFNYSDLRGIAKGFSYAISYLKLIFLCIKYKPNVVHYQWLKIYFFDLNAIKLIKLILPNTKIVYTAHNILPHGSGIKYERIFGKLYKQFHQIIVHDNISKSTIKEKFRIDYGKIHVIPHGVLDYSKFLEECEPLQMDVFSNIPDNATVYALIGNINKYKGVDLLFEAWEKVFKNDGTKYLIIAGKDKHRLTLPFRKFNNVSLITRFLKDEEFITILKKSHCILLPYIKISQSGVLLTLINEHKPVIVSPLNGLIEPFSIGQIGCVMERVDAESLSDCITRMDREVLSGIENNIEMWNRVKKYYSWESIAIKTLKVYFQ